MEKTDIKTAVSKATNFIKEAYSDQDVFDILLEEIKEVNEGEDWAVTISFKRKIPDDIPLPFTALIDNRMETKFKRIVINKDSSEIVKMEHREFNSE